MSLSHLSFELCVRFVSICMLGAIYSPQMARGQPNFPGGTIDLMVPQFVAEAVSFKAIDESGYDSPGADEVRAVFSDLNPKLIDLVTEKYNGVDTGETRSFGPNERCIAPRPKCDHGISELLHFELSFWEADDPPWPFTQFCYGDIAGLHYWLRHESAPGDRLIRRGEVVVSREQLLAALPGAGDSVEHKLILGGPCGPSQDICGIGLGSATGPEYELTYRITRLDDVRRPLVIAPPRGFEGGGGSRPKPEIQLRHDQAMRARRRARA